MKLCTVFHLLTTGSVLFCGTLLTKSVAAEQQPPADFIIHNARVLTVNSNFTVAEAVAVRGNEIVAVGREKQVEHLKGTQTRMIDAHGHTVMPGLYDSEVDSFHASVPDTNAPAQPLHSIAEGLAFIRSQVAQKPTGAWIIIEGAYPTRMDENRLPTKEELDGAAPKNPVFWNCGVIAMVNTKALEVSHITSGLSSPVGGEVVTAFATSKPTGLLRNASSVLKLPPAAKSSAPEQHRDALKKYYQSFNQQGITSIGERAASPEAIYLFREMAASNELTVRINCARYVDPASITEDKINARLDALTNGPAGLGSYGPSGTGDNWVRIGPLMTRLDGDISTGTAYLRTPYGIGETYQIGEPAYRGQILVDSDALTSFVVAAAKRGWQVGVDCTGDAALDQLMNCYEKTQFKVNIRQRKFLIGHATFQATEDWSRCQRLGVVAEMQPSSFYADGSSIMKTLGQNRLKYFMSFKTWNDGGMLIGAGSGENSTNLWNPWLGLWVTLSRQTSTDTGINQKEQALTREQAVRFYTVNNARIHFEESRKGTLEPGKLADLIVLDHDIMKCPEHEVRSTRVLLTVVDGKIVWDANAKVTEPNLQVSEKSPAATPNN